MTRPRGRPRKHPVPVPVDLAPVESIEEAVRRELAGEPAPPRCTGRLRWKGSSGAHPRGALQVAWQCAGGIEWRPIEFAHADAPDTEDA